jgi:hypothetical protein
MYFRTVNLALSKLFYKVAFDVFNLHIFMPMKKIKLYPYFGGDEPAPHTILIFINDL